MSKLQLNSLDQGETPFFERRRMRRIRMIVDLTSNLIRRDPSLSHHEARCLLTCARKAILEIDPAFHSRFETLVAPHLEQVLRRRWPSEELLFSYENDTIN